MARIESPVAGYTGPGPASLTFVDGIAESDNPGVVAYCQGAGYIIDGAQLNPPPAPAAGPSDPRLVEVAASAPLRDAAVDPRPGDVPPTNAGRANPHGPLVVAPGHPIEPVTDPVTVEPPARSASKAVWLAFAVEHRGADQAEAEGLTRDQLAETYGGTDDGPR